MKLGDSSTLLITGL